jgi:hypothetical protein
MDSITRTTNEYMIITFIHYQFWVFFFSATLGVAILELDDWTGPGGGLLGLLFTYSLIDLGMAILFDLI